MMETDLPNLKEQFQMNYSNFTAFQYEQDWKLLYQIQEHVNLQYNRH